MARYVTIEQFKTDYGDKLLVRLFALKDAPTDPEPDAADASAKFEKIADEVCDEIDGFLRRRYSLPLAVVPNDLASKALRMVIYYGHLKSPAGTVAQKLRDDYTDIKGWLSKIAEGKVDLGLTTAPAENSDRSIEISSNERVLTQSRLRGVI